MTNRKLVFLMLSILTTVALVLDFASDAVLDRSAKVGGLGVAASWDIISGALFAVWVIVAIRIWRGRA